VFKCDSCSNPDTNAFCRECNQSGGYLKKLMKGSSEDDLGFIHPVCAMAWPNIYQFGSPVNMSIKLCAGVEVKDINKFSDPDNECSICDQKTARTLKC
jgi:hypothetical protein